MNNTLHFATTLLHPTYYHILEFGVYYGSTIKQLRDTLPLQYKCFGFDSFEGLPEDWTYTSEKRGAMSCKGIIPNIDNVIFYKGWFKDTISNYIKNAESIALVHIDCDLYSSTIDVLYGIKDFIKSGTILVFDEWYYNHNDIQINRQHEQKAFFEWATEFSINYAFMPQIEDERQIIKIL